MGSTIAKFSYSVGVANRTATWTESACFRHNEAIKGEHHVARFLYNGPLNVSNAVSRMILMVTVHRGIDRLDELRIQ